MSPQDESRDLRLLCFLCMDLSPSPFFLHSLLFVCFLPIPGPAVSPCGRRGAAGCKGGDRLRRCRLVSCQQTAVARRKGQAPRIVRSVGPDMGLSGAFCDLHLLVSRQPEGRDEFNLPASLLHGSGPATA